VLIGDGAVVFISDSIYTGARDSPSLYRGSIVPPNSESPYGIWGALGTRSQGQP
jgi:hypothetical protein